MGYKHLFVQGAGLWLFKYYLGLIREASQQYGISVTLIDPNPIALENVRQASGSFDENWRYVQSLEQVEPNSEEVLVLIVTPNAFHCEGFCRSLDLFPHATILVEKLLCSTRKEWAVMCEALADHPNAKAFAVDHYCYKPNLID